LDLADPGEPGDARDRPQGQLLDITLALG
jgi:hypothetical protein